MHIFQDNKNEHTAGKFFACNIIDVLDSLTETKLSVSETSLFLQDSPDHFVPCSDPRLVERDEGDAQEESHGSPHLPNKVGQLVQVPLGDLEIKTEKKCPSEHL